MIDVLPTARHSRSGELLFTAKFMVQTLAAAGELQGDLQHKLTHYELRAAEARSSKGGRRPAAPARDYHVSRGAIRPTYSARPAWIRPSGPRSAKKGDRTARPGLHAAPHPAYTADSLPAASPSTADRASSR
ncbi:hypothetical protein [Streptomyces sp. SAS_276]|uniref:hypothetical protein n=1 Tax=Streptomyces sp. SAS_276 TaxID=3412745 RepID=UPI00403C870C